MVSNRENQQAYRRRRMDQVAIATIMLRNKLPPKSQWFATNIYFSLRGLQVNWDTLIQAMSQFRLAPDMAGLSLRSSAYKGLISSWCNAGVQATKLNNTNPCKDSGCYGALYIHHISLAKQVSWPSPKSPQWRSIVCLQ